MLEIRPLSQGEIAWVREDFVDVCLEDPAALVSAESVVAVTTVDATVVGIAAAYGSLF